MPRGNGSVDKALTRNGQKLVRNWKAANVLLRSYYNVITRDGGKWWSKDHHLVVVKIVKNVAFSLKNVKKW